MAFGTDFQETKQSVNAKTTGVHDVSLVRLGIKDNKTGSKSLTLTVNAGGEYDDTLYLGVFEKADGTDGFEKAKTLNPLAYILGVTDDSIGIEEVKTKNGTTEVKVFKGFPRGAKFKIVVQQVVNNYNGKMEPKLIGVFAQDGRSASEIRDGLPAQQLAKAEANLKQVHAVSKPQQSQPDVASEAEDIF